MPALHGRRTSALFALVRFHWGAGARAALRANAVVLGAIVFLFGSAPDAAIRLRALILGIAAKPGLASERGVIAAIAMLFAVTAAPRVLLGGQGWMRSLPVDGRTVWRASVAALCIAQSPVWTFAIVAAAAAVTLFHAPLSAASLIALPIMFVAASVAAIPTRRMHTRGLAAVAMIAAIRGTSPAIALAVSCLVAADQSGASIARAVRRPPQRRARLFDDVRFLWTRASWRALGTRSVVTSAIAPMIFASFGFLVLRNNPGIEPHAAATAVRIAGGLAVAIFASSLSNSLLRARQPWPWARSLPWSSRDRIIADIVVIGGPVLLIPLALTLANVGAAIAVACEAFLGAAIGASAIRKGAERQTGAAGECLTGTLIAATVVAVWPIAALLALAAAPLVVAMGARRERMYVASRWTELHHSAAGDAGWLGPA